MLQFACSSLQFACSYARCGPAISHFLGKYASFGGSWLRSTSTPLSLAAIVRGILHRSFERVTLRGPVVSMAIVTRQAPHGRAPCTSPAICV